MSLFSKEKDLILKICNGVLILWFIAALVFTASSTINLIVKEEKYTYKEYKVLYCDTIGKEVYDSCENEYARYEINQKRDNKYNYRSLYTSLSNVVIVSTILFILNKKKGK